MWSSRPTLRARAGGDDLGAGHAGGSSLDGPCLSVTLTRRWSGATLPDPARVRPEHNSRLKAPRRTASARSAAGGSSGSRVDGMTQHREDDHERATANEEQRSTVKWSPRKPRAGGPAMKAV